MLSEKAIATATAVAVLATLGVAGGIGVPTYIDSNVDQQPDQPLYGLEKAGEAIKGTIINAGLYGDKADLNQRRWRERIGEYENIAKENKASKYMGVLKRAQKRLDKTCKCVDEEEEMESVREMAQKHLKVLKRIRENVPEEALFGIQTAIRNAKRYRKALENAMDTVRGRKTGGRKRPNIRKIIENQMGEVKDRIEEIPTPHERRHKRGR